MHYTVKYVGDDQAKRAAALQDTKEFLGEDRFEKLTNLFCESEQPVDQMVLMISFTGVQGLPAIAWAEHVDALRARTVEHA